MGVDYNIDTKTRLAKITTLKNQCTLLDINNE